jgi:hypothetical protein
MSICIILIAYFGYYIFKYYSVNNILWDIPANSVIKDGKPVGLLPNEIGDSIGGILNPIIGLIASILTFLAFYMQKVANDEIRIQFKKQQFETQFYEMLRLHKDNVNEIEVKDDNDNIYKGRAAFKYASDQIKQILSRMVITYPVSNDFKNPFLSEAEIFPTKFYVAYQVLFWGDQPARTYKLKDSLFSFANTQSTNKNIQWHSHLGHYYRHLFSMVKFVVSNKDVPMYEDKMRYLKILRAQLSNYEQIMLFYNWLCEGYGDAWEEEEETGNKFLTEYKMIHNLWVNELMPNPYFTEKVNYLIDEYNKRKKDTPLFEFQGENFEKKWG